MTARSCPVGFNCKHVAAVLFEYQEQAALAPGIGTLHPQQHGLPRAGQPAEGPSIAGDLAWRLFEDGSQRPELALPAPSIALRLAIPWYVDPATGVMGPVEINLPARLIQAMLAAPALPPAIAGHVREEMTRRWPSQSLPAPTQLAPPQRLQESLQPHCCYFPGSCRLIRRSCPDGVLPDCSRMATGREVAIS